VSSCFRRKQILVTADRWPSKAHPPLPYLHAPHHHHHGRAQFAFASQEKGDPFELDGILDALFDNVEAPEDEKLTMFAPTNEALAVVSDALLSIDPLPAAIVRTHPFSRMS
jgi:hypothetical protein